MSLKIGELTNAEWEIMRICWEKGKASAKTIHEESLDHKKRNYITVKTILDRISQKGYLRREFLGNVIFYTPIVSQKTATSQSIDDFIKTVMGDHIAPIFMHMVKTKKYRKELSMLKKIVNEIDEDIE